METKRISAFFKSNAKRTVMLSLCLIVLIACIFTVAITAVENESQVVATIGDAKYEEFSDALTAASAMSGDVTVEIYGKVTLSTALGGSYDSITFVGKTDNAEIYLDVQGYITATGKDVAFEDLKLSKSVGGYVTNAGFMNLAFGVYDVKTVTYTDCTFLNGACASSGVVTYNGCTFYRSHDRYGMWAYGDVDVFVDNCVFDDFRGIKMYAEGGKKTVNLTVTNTDFSAVSNKPAIVLTYGESVTLSGNTYSSTGVFELDMDGAPDGTVVKSNDEITCINDNGACGVLVTDNSGVVKIYTTLSGAVASIPTTAAAGAANGYVVTLLSNTEETVTLPEGVKLNTNGYTAANVTVDENTPAFAPVVKIGNYVYYNTLVDALKALKSGDVLTLLENITITENWDNRYTGAKISVPVTIDGNGHKLTFTGTINDGYNYLSVFRFEAAATVKDLTMDMSEAISGWGSRLRAIAAKSDLTVDGSTFIGNPEYTNTNAIIFGEGAATGSLNVSVTNSSFVNWKNGVSDDQGGKDTAKNVTVSNSTFESANVNVSATESVNFSGNEMEESWMTIKSYTNTENFAVTAMNNTLEENTATFSNKIEANPANITTDVADLKPVAQLGNKFFTTTDALFRAITDNSGKLVLNADLYIFAEKLTLPAGATFNGNGYYVYGNVVAGGDLTFEGYSKIKNFNAGYDAPTITITAGATLEMFSSDRMVIGHGATFNITGTIDDAKTADVANVTPSLIAAGASFTGAGVDFNATNAYLKFTAYCSSKNSSANGTFDFDVTNCIWEQSNTLVFAEPTNGKDPIVNFDLTDSVLTSTSHLVFAVSKGDIVIDNSNVNKDNRKQLEIRSTMTIKNGAVVHASDATSSNAKKPGTLIVDGATYNGSGEYSGSDAGIGTLILKNGAVVTLGNVSKTEVYTDSTSSFTCSTLKDTADRFDMGDYEFTITVDKNALKATESLDAIVSINADYYSAEYTFTYDPTMFTCEADLDGDGVIYVTKLYKGNAGELATYTLVAKNDIASVSNGNIIEVNGNAIQYKQQIVNDIVNNVAGDIEYIKVSLNYTAAVVADYVSGYSLVLVYGADGGYAYNGVKMFYVEAYGAYATLVEGSVDADMIDVALSKATGCRTLAPTYDVNCDYVTDGVVDLKDATAIYACASLDFAVENYMDLFLRADVNADGVVNMIDINAVTEYYNN